MFFTLICFECTYAKSTYAINKTLQNSENLSDNTGTINIEKPFASFIADTQDISQQVFYVDFMN